MSAHGLAPDSRRRRLRRLLPGVAAVVLLLVVFASFVLLPSVEGASLTEAPPAAEAIHASPDAAGEAGTHDCPEG